MTSAAASLLASRPDLPWLPDSVILRCEAGSGLHGISVGDQDDHDEMAVVIEPPEYRLGLKRKMNRSGNPVTFTSEFLRTKPEGVRSGPGDTDLTVHSLRKFLRLAKSGNPTITQLFYIPEAKIYDATPTGRGLLALRDAVVSRRAIPAYCGYLREQKERLLGLRGQKDVNRPELIERYGFDTKFAAHAARLGFQGVELMGTGRIVLPIESPIREWLVDVRTGRVPFAEVLSTIERLESQLRAVADGDGLPLPADADHDAIDRFLVTAYFSEWWTSPSAKP